MGTRWWPPGARVRSGWFTGRLSENPTYQAARNHRLFSWAEKKAADGSVPPDEKLELGRTWLHPTIANGSIEHTLEFSIPNRTRQRQNTNQDLGSPRFALGWGGRLAAASPSGCSPDGSTRADRGGRGGGCDGAGGRRRGWRERRRADGGGGRGWRPTTARRRGKGRRKGREDATLLCPLLWYMPLMAHVSYCFFFTFHFYFYHHKTTIAFPFLYFQVQFKDITSPKKTSLLSSAKQNTMLHGNYSSFQEMELFDDYNIFQRNQWPVVIWERGFLFWLSFAFV